MPIFRYFTSYLAVSLILLSLSTMVLAQSSGATTGAIVGIVKDSQGAALTDTKVTIRQVETNLTRVVTTDLQGNYSLIQLSPGNYEVTVNNSGFNETIENVRVNIGTTALVEFALTIAGSQEVIEVHASSLVGAEKTESSTIIDNQAINALPINQRNFLDFALTSAHVTKDRVPTQGATMTSQLSFNGQSARLNNITIDGLDNNDSAAGSVRSTFSQEAVQEFQVVSDSYSAEFGRALGGIVNIVTKGGTNELHGNVFNFVRNEVLSARNTFASINPEFKQYQFGASGGGAIKPNRIFFFQSFERFSLKQNNIVTIADQTVNSAQHLGLDLHNGPRPFSVGKTTVLSRLDTYLSPNDRLWVRYNGGFIYDGNFEPFEGLTADNNGGIQRLGDNSLAINNTYTSSQRPFVNETRFLYNKFNQQVAPVTAQVNINLTAPEGMVSFGRNIILPQPRNMRLYQIVDNLTLMRGRHQFKTGIDYAYSSLDAEVPIAPTGSAFFQPIDFAAQTGVPGFPFFTGLQAFDPSLRTPAQKSFLDFLSQVLPGQLPGFPRGLALANLSLPTAYVQGFGDPRIGVTTHSLAAFVQDDIKLKSNLLIKLGLRYDLGLVNRLPSNNGNFSPRVAVHFTPTKLPNLRLHGAYGLFFGSFITGPAFSSISGKDSRLKILVLPLPFSVIPFSTPTRNFTDTNILPANVRFTPQLSQEVVVDKNLRSSYSQQISLGTDLLLSRNTAISLSYDFVRGIKLLSSRNVNPVVHPQGNALQSLQTGRSQPDRGDIFEYESAYDSYYHGVTVAIERSFTNQLGFRASYTFSKAIDNFVDFRPDIQEFVNPLQIGQERALSLQDVRQRFLLSGVWQIGNRLIGVKSFSLLNRAVKDLQISAILELESGLPYNLKTGVDLDLNGDNPPSDRPLGLGRNVGIKPSFANLNLRLARNISLTEHYKLQLIVEGFNIFNHVNVSQVDNIFPPDAQGNFSLPKQENGRYLAPSERYRGAFAPRQLQVGLRFTF